VLSKLVFIAEMDCVFCEVRAGVMYVVWKNGRLVTSLLSRRHGCRPRSFHVRFVVDRVALGQVFIHVLRFSPVYIVGWDSSVGIATRYELDGPGIESRWGARFSTSVQNGPGAYPASCTMGTGSFPGVKRPGRGVDPPHLAPRLRKE
jgi:hypothetical protein